MRPRRAIMPIPGHPIVHWRLTESGRCVQEMDRYSRCVGFCMGVVKDDDNRLLPGPNLAYEAWWIDRMANGRRVV